MTIPLVAAPGCAVHQVEYAGSPPPEDRAEQITPRPGPRYAWLPGRWVWRQVAQRYVWKPGKWKRIRHPHHRRWVPGKWQATPQGYRWQRGHWR